MYRKGDLLPETFTHHDKARSIYNSRIGVCEVSEEETNVEENSAETPVTIPESTPPADPSKEGTQSADEKPKFNFNLPLTGTMK